MSANRELSVLVISKDRRSRRLAVAVWSFVGAALILAVASLWGFDRDTRDPFATPATTPGSAAVRARTTDDEAGDTHLRAADPVAQVASALAPLSGPPSSRPSKPDARFGVRWQQPGQCRGEDEGSILARRQVMLARFESTPIAEVQLLHDPDVPRASVTLVADALERARSAAVKLVEWSPLAQAPPVILYRSDDQLHAVACVNQSAIGYYDGTIHVSVDPSHVPSHVAETVIHEYMHHVLNAMGVRQPMWLHEGLAILAAGERWFNDWRLQLKPWIRQNHLPFDALVTASPHTADETFAMAAYYQSYLMVRLVGHRRGEDFFRVLLRYITDGTVTPQEAFIHGVGLPASHLEAAWAEFVNTATQR